MYEIFTPTPNSNSNSNIPLSLGEGANSITPTAALGGCAVTSGSRRTATVSEKPTVVQYSTEEAPNSVSELPETSVHSIGQDNPHGIKKETGGKFRFQGRFMFLTIAGHWSEKDYIPFIDRNFNMNGKSNLKKWIIGREIGESGYKHSHVVIEFHEKICFQKADRLDFKGNHPCIQTIKTTFADAVHYAAKDEDYDSNFDISEVVPIQKKFDKIMSAKTKRDVLREARSIQEGQAALNIYKMCRKDELVYETLDLLKPWQQEVTSEIEVHDNDRAIFWIADETGASGKSSLSQHIAATNDGVCIIPDVSTPENIARAIQNHKEEQGEIDTVIIDIARGVGNYISLYRIMEQCKNNMVFCPKYDSRTIQLNTKGRGRRPRVIIFSNTLPKKDDLKQLTYDRWRIYQIKNNLLDKVERFEIEREM